MKRFFTSIVFAGIVAIICASMQAPCAVAAAGWGSIKGRIIVDGKVPAPKPFPPGNDPFCNALKPMERSLLVGKDNALENAVVYLKLATGEKVEVNPKYNALLKQPAVINNKNCAFDPHVVLMRVGQTLEVKNSDPTGHNTKASLVANGAFNFVVAANGAQTAPKMGKAESIPMLVNCNMHEFMEGHILIQDHPYMAVTGPDGKFEIKDIPVGKHKFQLWHETAGYLKEVPYKGGKASNRGQVEATIAAGQTLDLGDIEVPARVLIVTQ